jgi:hypothetical protein
MGADTGIYKGANGKWRSPNLSGGDFFRDKLYLSHHLPIHLRKVLD